MGLLQKALKFQKEIFQRKRLSKASLVVDDWEKYLPYEHATLLSLDKKELEESDRFLHLDDLHSSTRPVVHGLAQQSQIESLLSLIEFTKELGVIQTEEDLWDTVILTLIGQIGCRQSAIFFMSEKSLILKANRGLKIKKKFSIPFTSDLIKKLALNMRLYYIKDLLHELPKKEQKWFTSLKADLVIPIIFESKLVGLIIVGKPLGFPDYNLEDLQYLKLFGEILGHYYKFIEKIIIFSQGSKLWKNRDIKHEGMKKYLEYLEESESIEEFMKIFSKTIEENYGVRKYVFFFRENQKFIPAIYEGLQPMSVQRLITLIKEDWIIEIKRLKGWYEYKDFRKNNTFMKKFSSEDISLTSKIFVLPVYFKDHLEGVFLLLQTMEELNKEELLYLQLIIRNYYWRLLMHRMDMDKKVEIDRKIEYPLYELRLLVQDREQDLKEKKIPYIMLTIKIIYSKRIKKDTNEKELDQIRIFVKRTIHSYISESDHLIEILPNFFFLILKGMRIEDSENLMAKIRDTILIKYKDEYKRPILETKKLARPLEALISLDSFLFD